MCARRKPLLPTCNKDMFGEQLQKSAVTRNHIWTVHVRADTIQFLATEKYWEGWGSGVQRSNAALRPAAGSLQAFTARVAWQLVLTPLTKMVRRKHWWSSPAGLLLLSKGLNSMLGRRRPGLKSRLNNIQSLD